jgi:glycosyltransferase involved in cell wall biosynthesis
MKTLGFCVDKVITGGADKVLIEIFNGLLSVNKYKLKLFSYHRIVDDYFLNYFRENKIEITIMRFPQERPKKFLDKIKWRLDRKKWNKTFHNLINEELSKCDVLIDFKNGVCYKSIREIPHKLKILWIHTATTFVEETILKNCDINSYGKVVSVSETVKNDLINKKICGGAQVFCIYNPIDIDYISNKAKEPLNIGDNYFICVSRLDKGKDIITLIQAYKQFISETKSNTKLYILGDGRLAERFKIESGALLDNQIKFLGNINEPYNYIKNAKALILSSESEGFPVVLVESMIVGTLVIASNCPSGVAEALENGECGILFEPKNVQELKNIMIKVDKGAIDMQKLINSASNSLDRFKIETILPKIEQLFGFL